MALIRGEDFFSEYIAYAHDTEVPVFFHRWAAIASVGALLGRSCWFQHGHFLVHPNIYCMLIGKPATRKTTAIKLIKSLIRKAGYTEIAADKSTKEKFILDLAGKDFNPETNESSVLDQNLWGDSNESLESEITEMFIMADEFNDFFGNNILDFVAFLGNLWDYVGVYENKVKNSSSVKIPNPTISILGGNTPTSFSTAFPPEIIGQGFFSRILLIYGEPSGKQITFPEEPKPEDTAHIVSRLRYIRNNPIGKIPLTPTAKLLLDKIYKTWKGVDDVRFESYSNRRFTHLIKLCMVHAAACRTNEISEEIVIYANTVLAHTEHLMPKALGEFGRAKYSDTSHKVISIIENNDNVTSIKQIWKHIHNDLESMTQLAEILRKLVGAEKIQSTKGGFLPVIKVVTENSTDLVDYTFLTEEERKYHA